ncbi:hypothetical protein QQP08_011096 [Theobroma cacao]|nr:hypothetical protein QQP08_011096 [Theobroma cacao]
MGVKYLERLGCVACAAHACGLECRGLLMHKNITRCLCGTMGRAHRQCAKDPPMAYVILGLSCQCGEQAWLAHELTGLLGERCTHRSPLPRFLGELSTHHSLGVCCVPGNPITVELAQ